MKAERAALALLTVAFLTSAPALARDVVSFGRPLEVSGDVGGAVVSLGGRTVVTGHVRGDVVLFFGTAVFRPGARVDGDLLALGTEVTFEGTTAAAAVRGRVRTVRAAEAAYAAELRSAPLAGAALSPLVVSFRLALVAVWLVAGALLLRVAPRRVQAAADASRGRLGWCALLGAAAVLSATLLLAAAFALLPSRGALVVTIVVGAALLLAKLFGLVAVFVVLGRRLTRGARRGSALFGDPSALAVGLAVLGVASVIPWAGPLIWGAASLVGIGIALESLLAREERLSLAAA